MYMQLHVSQGTWSESSSIFTTLCVLAEKILSRLWICADWPKSKLLLYAINNQNLVWEGSGTRGVQYVMKTHSLLHPQTR